MGNKNRYNDYFNGGNNTPEHFTEEKENENVEKNIVESTDNNAVETTSVDNITPESLEIIDNEEVIEKTEDSVKNLANQEESQNDDSVTKNVQNVRVNTKALNIRKEPKKDSDILTIVYQDELLMLCESTSIDGFYKVRTYTGFDGYCMEQFVDLV